MRFLIQVVTEASVTVGEQTAGSIGRGMLVFVGVGQDDDRSTADKMIKKLLGLRIFADENGKTNLNLEAVGGELLVVSQFTLYADLRRGNRPGFSYAGSPDKANELYEYILEMLRMKVPVVQQGIFGADMKVALVNDGPFTIILDSEDLA